MNQWDQSGAGLPTVPPPDPRQTGGYATAVAGSLPPVAPPGMQAELVATPQQFMPPQPHGAPAGQTTTPRIAGWVRALAVIVSVVKMLPILLAMVVLLFLGAAWDVGAVGVALALILAVPLLIIGIQIFMAMAQRRLGLQITAGIFMLLDLASLAASYQNGAAETLGLGLLVAVAQAAVFIGSLIDPAKK